MKFNSNFIDLRTKFHKIGNSIQSDKFINFIITLLSFYSFRPIIKFIYYHIHLLSQYYFIIPL